jgi:hypothetical protein
MGRFTSTTPPGYTNAKVFTTPGTTSFTVPTTNAKVYVIGAGSCYRPGTFCFQSTGCCSGVAGPVCNYCLNFCGHLTGAGGGYAEKTYTNVAGCTMTINVGTQGGLTASSVAVAGLTTVTASNATETAVNWACTSNSTARNNSNDNPVSLGFNLPVCGYINCISGYWNTGGTASGGDVNRTGGKGTITPYFVQDSCFDATSGTGTTCTITTTLSGGACGCICWSCQIPGYDYSFGGTRYTCTCINVATCGRMLNNRCSSCIGITDPRCICQRTYHNVFGPNCCSVGYPNGGCFYAAFSCNMCFDLSCAKPVICTVNCSAAIGFDGETSCTTSSGLVGIKYVFAGSNTRESAGYYGKSANENSSSPETANNLIEDRPAGIGAESGKSDGDGLNGFTETQVQNFVVPSAGAGGAQTLTGGCCGYGAGNFPCCFKPFGDDFTFVFGSNRDQCPWVGLYDMTARCFCASVTQVGAGLKVKCFNIGFTKDYSLYRPATTGLIPLSTLKSDTGTNLTDIRYGNGANINAAGYGGGGNRLNPNGGQGLVVVLY